MKFKIIRYFFFFFLVVSQNLNAQTRGAELINKTSEAEIGDGYALVFGVSAYKKVTPLLYADDDATLFKQFLIKNKLVKESERYMKFFTDETATRSNFFASIGYILNHVKAGDRVYIYFAGHGDIQMNIDLGYLLAYACETNTDYNGTDAIPLLLLDPYLENIASKNARVYLILDACRSGKADADIKGESKTYFSVQSRFKNCVKFLSSSPDELSYERHFPEGGHGLFTYYLVKGWSGQAVNDADTLVDLKSLKRYLEDKVAENSKNKQNPLITGDNTLILSPVIPVIKAAYANQSQEILAVNTPKKDNNRSIDTSYYSGAKEKEIYAAFLDFIRKGQLISPAKNNAYELFLNAENLSGNAKFKEDLRWEIFSYLEDNSQKLINRYVNGELGDMRGKNMLVSKWFDECSEILDKAASLIGPDDPYYKTIIANKEFSKGYSLFKTYKKVNVQKGLLLLLHADSLSPGRAYIQNAIGLCYISLGSDKGLTYFNNAIKLAPDWIYPKGNIEAYMKKKSAKKEENPNTDHK